MPAKKKTSKKKKQKKEEKPRVQAGNVTIRTPKQEYVKERLDLLQECSSNIRQIINTVEGLQRTGKVEMQGDYQIGGNVTIGDTEETNLKDSHFIFTGEGDQTISSDTDFHDVTIDKQSGTMTVKDTMMRILKDLTFLTQNMG